MDASYSTLEGWHDRAHLGMALCKRMNIAPEQSYLDILRTAFANYAAEQRAVAAAEDADIETTQRRIEAGIDYVVSLLFGAIDMTHPEEA